MNKNRQFKFVRLNIEPEYQASLSKYSVESKEDFLDMMGSVWDQYVSSGFGEDCFDTDEEYNHYPNHWMLSVSMRIEPCRRQQ